MKNSLSMRKLSVNNFDTKLLSKLLSDLYIGVHLKEYVLSITNLTTKLLSIKNYFLNGPQ